MRIAIATNMTSFIPKRNLVVHLVVLTLNLIIISFVTGETLITGNRAAITAKKIVDSDKTQRSLSDRIISGTPAVLGEFPSFAFAVDRCGGSLISPDLVLTAAHCKNAFADAGEVRVGGITNSTGQLIHIEEIINHPKFDENILKNDIAIIKLKCSSRAPLQKLHLTNFNPRDARKLISIGMGYTDLINYYSDGLLNKVTLNHVPLRACRDKYKSRGSIVRSNICAESSILGDGKSACYGDSGSPILYYSTALPSITNATRDVVQVGLTSWGIDCNTTDYPVVYTRVSSYKGFIEETIAKYSDPVPKYCE